MFVLSLIMGILLGVAVAIFIVGGRVNRSNNTGDSVGTFQDFSAPLNMLEAEDKIRHNSTLAKIIKK